MKVVNTTGWEWEQLSRYTKDVTAAMKKLAVKFPDDCTAESLAQECINGEQQLWLILDDEDGFVSFCMTQIRTIDATGKKMVTLTNMAGEMGLDCADAMCEEIHRYSDEQDADLTATIGSRAWIKPLKKHGYKEYAVILRRDAR